MTSFGAPSTTVVTLKLAADQDTYSVVHQLRAEGYNEVDYRRVMRSDAERPLDRLSWVALASWRDGSRHVPFGSVRALPLRYFEPELAQVLPLSTYMDLIDELGDRRDRTVEVARVVSAATVRNVPGVFVTLLGGLRFLVDQLHMDTVVSICNLPLVGLYRAMGVEVFHEFDYLVPGTSRIEPSALMIVHVEDVVDHITALVEGIEFSYDWPTELAAEPTCLWSPTPPGARRDTPDDVIDLRRELANEQ